MPPSPNAKTVLARQVRAARRQAGLTGRELATLCGLSQATVSAIERGRDVERGTLQSLMSVLPGVDPRPLLGRPTVGPRPATRRLWRFFADTLGFRARRVMLRVRLDSAGGQTTDLEVTGLRSTDGAPCDRARLIALMGAALVGSLRTTFGLRGLGDTGPGETLRIEDGDLLHVFDIPADLAGTGLTYRRVDRGPPRPAGSLLPGQAPHGLPFALGTCLWLDYPAERLVFRVEFEGEDRPASVRPEAWPASVGVDPSHPIAAGLGPFFEIPETEMYGEFFDVPAPDELVFMSWFAGGEVFRSGAVWRRGKGDSRCTTSTVEWLWSRGRLAVASGGPRPDGC